MPVSDTTPEVSYVGNGTYTGGIGETAYAIPFRFDADSHVKLYIDGVLSSDAITVSGAGSESGGSATTSRAYLSTQRVTFIRESPSNQVYTYIDGDRRPASTVLGIHDDAVMQTQEVARDLGRTPKAYPGDTPPGGSFIQSALTSVGQDASGDIVSRTPAEELAHLGITDVGVLPGSISATNVFTVYTDPDVGAITLVIDGADVVFPSSTTHDQDQAAAALATLINAGGYAVTATSSGPFLTVTAILEGEDGDGITCSVSLGGAYGAWSSATTTGGTLSGVVLTGLAQNFSTAQKEQAQSNIGLYGAPFIVQGEGIDPTGNTPSTVGINNFLAAQGPGSFYFPEGFYWLDGPIVMNSRRQFTGAGGAPFDSIAQANGTPHGTTFFAKEGYPYTVDSDGHRTMFISHSWDTVEWMHWTGFSNCGVDGNNHAEYGFKIYRMGECSHISECQIQKCINANIWATGSHAPFTLNNCTIGNKKLAWDGAAFGVGTIVWTAPTPTGSRIGIHFGNHPKADPSHGVDQHGDPESGGVCRLIGLSGDNNHGGIVRISGSQQVTIVGVKTESNPYAVFKIDSEGRNTLVDGIRVGTVGIGGGAASLSLIGGYSQDTLPILLVPGTTDPNYKPAEEIIRIEDEVTPSINFNGFQWVKNTTLDAGNYPIAPALLRNIDLSAAIEVIPIMNGAGSHRVANFTYGARSQFDSSLILGKKAKVFGTEAGGTVFEMLKMGEVDDTVALSAWETQTVALRAGSSPYENKVSASTVGVGFNGAAPFAPATITGVRGSESTTSQVLSYLQSLGLITDSTTAGPGVVYTGGYTVGTLPSVTTGGFIHVSDETGGHTAAFSDGTNWRRVQDRAVVS